MVLNFKVKYKNENNNLIKSFLAWHTETKIEQRSKTHVCVNLHAIIVAMLVLVSTSYSSAATYRNSLFPARILRNPIINHHNKLNISEWEWRKKKEKKNDSHKDEQRNYFIMIFLFMSFAATTSIIAREINTNMGKGSLRFRSKVRKLEMQQSCSNAQELFSTYVNKSHHYCTDCEVKHTREGRFRMESDGTASGCTHLLTQKVKWMYSIWWWWFNWNAVEKVCICLLAGWLHLALFNWILE